MKKTILGAIAIAIVCSVPITAQWPKYEESGVPRDAKGSVLLEAPPPGQVPLAAAFDRPPAPQAAATDTAATVAGDDGAAPHTRGPGVRNNTAEPVVDTSAQPVWVPTAPAPAPAVEIDATAPLVRDSPAPVVADAVPPGARVAPFQAPSLTPAGAWSGGATSAFAPAVDDTTSAPVESAWWQSSRAVAALVAVAVAQSLVIGWLLSRPSAGLGGDGELVVQSRPEGAKVVVDDADRGVTPVTLRVSPGTHVLQVRAGASEPRVIPLLIRSGVQTAQYVELMGVASTGVLEVRSEPSKARVTIDGQARGSTPLTLRDVAPGNYQVVLERAGWKSTQVVRVEPGATAQLVVPIR